MSGKATIVKLLAKKLRYPFTSIGQSTRELADNKEISIVEFQKECLDNPEKDKLIDSHFFNSFGRRVEKESEGFSLRKSIICLFMNFVFIVGIQQV